MKKKLLLITMAISIVMTACGSENLETTDNADSNSIEITDDDGSDADMELSEDAVTDSSEDITSDVGDEVKRVTTNLLYELRTILINTVIITITKDLLDNLVVLRYCING